EAPAREEAPPLAELLAPVVVGAAGAGVLGGELRGGGRIAQGDDGGDQHRERGEGAGQILRGAEGDEGARADHRGEPDDHGVAQPEPTLEPSLDGGADAVAGKRSAEGVAHAVHSVRWWARRTPTTHPSCAGCAVDVLRG